jgi:hypothetical protein
MRIASENRHEIWVSLFMALLGLTFVPAMPAGYTNVLVLVSCLLVSVCCAINAALDMDAMSIPGKFLAVIWLGALTMVTGCVLIWAFGIREFSNR